MTDASDTNSSSFSFTCYTDVCAPFSAPLHDIPYVEQTVNTAITAVFQHIHVEGILPETENRTLEMAVRIDSNAAVQIMNRDFRGKDKPTNVLSFEMTSEDATAENDQTYYLGDIMVAQQVVEDEAKEEDKPLLHHFTHMIVHGTLHLLGFDHIEENEAEEMEALETKILAALDIPNPYEDKT